MTTLIADLPAGVVPRPHQARARKRIFDQWEQGHRSTLVVHPTGTGKTFLFGLVARRVIRDYGGRVLVLAHRNNLVSQGANSLADVGLFPAVEQGQEHARSPILGDPSCVVASVQTLQGQRLQSWPKNYFKAIITDECFPAGTLIDEQSIDSIRSGDEVQSYNHESDRVERRRVLRTSRRVPTSLVRVHLTNGQTLVCTPEHPFFASIGNTKASYVVAKQLSERTTVYASVLADGDAADADFSQDVRCLRDSLYASQLEPRHDSNLFGVMQGSPAGSKSQDSSSELHPMRQPGALSGKEGVNAGPERSRLLLDRLSESVRLSSLVGTDGEDQSLARFGSHEDEQSNDESCVPREDASDNAGDGLQACRSGRKWAGSNGTATSHGVGVGLADGSNHQDGHVGARGNWSAVALQDRRCESGVDDSDRTGRGLALRARETGSGRKKRRLSPIARVDSVEVLEPGSDGRFGGLCPDGYVYNLEVEGNHNYFANGILVHNCHHAISPTYRRIYDHFDHDWHLGVTATAERLDGENLGQIYETVADEYFLGDAIRDKQLAPITVISCETSVDLGSIRTGSEDFNQADLEAAIAPHVEELTLAIRKEVGIRKTIVFTPDVGSAQAVASALTSLGISAEWVAGSMSDKSQEDTLNRFRNGGFQALVNCQLCTEGFDAPAIAAVALLRPTLSESLYKQMVGRGTRLYAGKTDCLLLDFDWEGLTGLHKPHVVKPVALFNTTEADEETRALASHLLATGETSDLLEAIERATAKVERQRVIKVSAKDRQVRYRRVTYDMFGVDRAPVAADTRSPEIPFEHRPTLPQVETLVRMGVEGAHAMTKRRASQVLDLHIRRREQGLCSYKQYRCLVRNGIDATEAAGLSFAEASARLDMFFQGIAS